LAQGARTRTRVRFLRRGALMSAGPLHCIVRRRCGDLLGLWIAGTQLQTWTSSGAGGGWRQLGSVTTEAAGVAVGDPNLLVVPGTQQIFASFRLENLDKSWQVVVCRSDDDGASWVFDSLVIGPVHGHFVGAPFLFVTQRGDLQCYFDNEQEPALHGNAGAQWITMKQRKGLAGSWDAAGLVVVGAPAGFVRDGMATVVQLDDPARLMVVMEGVADGANVVHAAESFDSGVTWDGKTRARVYHAKRDDAGGLYNSYVPWAIKPAIPGPVFVAFCTDEDSRLPRDPCNLPPDQRHSTVKMVRTAATFEEWTPDATTVYVGSQHNYFPGLFPLSDCSFLSTVLDFGAGPGIVMRNVSTAGCAGEGNADAVARFV